MEIYNKRSVYVRRRRPELEVYEELPVLMAEAASMRPAGMRHAGLSRPKTVHMWLGRPRAD